jgi:hypothetical protein
VAEIRIIEGACGAGFGRYEAGLFTLPDGREIGVERLETFVIRNAMALEGRWAGEIVGGIRGAVDATVHLPLPLRLAAIGASRGLGLIDRAIRMEAILEAGFHDGTQIVISTSASVFHLICNDREVVTRARSRGFINPESQEAPLSDASEIQATTQADPAEQTDGASLASIFHYEKRKGRLRRVARNEAPDKP